MYFAYGEDDVVGFVDAPGVRTATDISLAVNASGVMKVSLMPLISPEDIDVASKVAVDLQSGWELNAIWSIHRSRDAIEQRPATRSTRM